MSSQFVNTIFSDRLKIAVILFLFIVILPLSSALTESFGVYKQNQNVNLIQTFNSTYCNITSITSPNSTIYPAGLMTKVGLKFNYTFVNTSEIGDYKVCGDCDTNAWCAAFTISSTGTILQTSQSIIYFVFLIAAIGLFFLCLYYAIKIPWQHQRDDEGYVIGVNELKYVKLFLICMTYIVLMFIAGLLRSVTANFIPETGVYRLFEWVFMIMLSFMYPLIVCSLVFALIIWISNTKFTKALERGIPLQ